MKCINCLTEMKNKSYDYYGFGDWDMDYPASHHEEHRCPNCKCKYFGGDDWEIPKTVEKPTEKQVNTILFINIKLKMVLKPLTKQQCIRDIGKYFEAAKAVANQPHYNDYDDSDSYDDYDWDPYWHCDPYWGNI